MSAKLLLCSCGGTQSPDPAAIGIATGLVCSRLYSGLCTGEAQSAAKAIAAGDAIIACGQESAFFEALAEDLDAPAPLMIDIRDRAGWSDDPSDKTPKIAALVALAQLAKPPEKTVDVVSEGLCLVLGKADVVLPVAEQLSGSLSVTCVTTDAPEMMPRGPRPFDCHQGRLKSAQGSMGRFTVEFDDFRAGEPGGRGVLQFSPARSGAKSECDLILDLRGEPALFPAHEKRDGYIRADPGNPLAVAKAAFDASHLVGTFERPLYVSLEENLCAHSRAKQVACSRCLDLCPTGAITPNGEHVAIDPNICAGCGACAAACPSSAIKYDAPPSSHVFAQVTTAARAYRDAGGKAPRLLVHDDEHGSEMISLSARMGRGLPADVVPLELSALGMFGHAEIMVALGSGFSAVDVLAGPKADREAIGAQIDLAAALLEGLGQPATRVRMIEPGDPDALSDLLFVDPPAPIDAAPVLALGGRREATRLAASALSSVQDAIIPLPAGAPYGAVELNQDACTLCMSCAGLCPSGALGDHPDLPQVRFQEDACLQCGLCVSICPENALTLVPRLNLADSALSEIILNEEEPYPCIECGRPFGVRSTIERIVEKLAGQHSMFTNSDNAKLIRMCDDCRVTAQYHSEAVPFFGGPRPKIRTADDVDDA